MRSGLGRVTALVVLVVSLFVWSPAGPIVLRPLGAGAAGAQERSEELRPAELPPPEVPADPGRQEVVSQPEVAPPVPEEPKPEPEPFTVETLPEPSEGTVLAERSSSTRLVWERPDGSFAAQVSVLPRWYLTGEGSWAEIDVSLKPIEDRPGWFATTAGAWSARFGPITAEGGGVEVVDPFGQVVSWRPSERAAVVEPVNGQ